jgi:hypothetical protein
VDSPVKLFIGYLRKESNCISETNELFKFRIKTMLGVGSSPFSMSSVPLIFINLRFCSVHWERIRAPAPRKSTKQRREGTSVAKNRDYLMDQFFVTLQRNINAQKRTRTRQEGTLSQDGTLLRH